MQTKIDPFKAMICAINKTLPKKDRVTLHPFGNQAIIVLR